MTTRIPSYISDKLHRCLWADTSNPLGATVDRVHSFLKSRHCTLMNDLHAHRSLLNDPIVSVEDNFDRLRFPPLHASRSPSHTYYLVNPNTVFRDSSLEKKEERLSQGGFRVPLPVHLASKTQLLRTHGTVHQPHFLELGFSRAAWTVTVFRKDEINRDHAPIFHQTDGYFLDTSDSSSTNCVSSASAAGIQISEFQHLLAELVQTALGKTIAMRWTPDSFPFTSPSYQLDVLGSFPLQSSVSSGRSPRVVAEKWVEVLGCGQIHPEILLRHRQKEGDVLLAGGGWAFGLGVERLAMLAYQIPDIRLFWSTDPRFTSQFKDGQLRTFRPYSRYPATVRDVSAWFTAESQNVKIPLSAETISALTQTLSEVAMCVAPGHIASVTLRDHFKKSPDKESLGWRIVYQSLEKTLTHQEVNALQAGVVNRLQTEFKWTTRGG